MLSCKEKPTHVVPLLCGGKEVTDLIVLCHSDKHLCSNAQRRNEINVNYNLKSLFEKMALFTFHSRAVLESQVVQCVAQ